MNHHRGYLTLVHVSLALFTVWLGVHGWQKLNPSVDNGTAPRLSTRDADGKSPAFVSAIGSAPAGAVTTAIGYDAIRLDRMFAEAIDNPDKEDRRLLLRGLAEFLARNHPEKAREYMSRLLAKGGLEDGDAYAFTQVFADTLAPRDPKALREWTEVLPDRLKDPAYQSLARHWVAADAKAAAEWASTVADSGLRATAIRALAYHFQHSDQTGYGAEWAAHLARTEDGPRFSDLIARQWARSDPCAAWEWVVSLGEIPERNQAVVAVTAAVAERDPLAALAWAGSLPAGATRDRALQETLCSWGTIAPAAAAAWLDSNSVAPELARNSASSIASAWIRTDRAAAIRWMAKVGIPQEQQNYFQLVTPKPTQSP